MRQHGTAWDARHKRTCPDKSAFVPTDEAAAKPDRRGHTPLGVSVCPDRRGSFLVAEPPRGDH